MLHLVVGLTKYFGQNFETLKLFAFFIPTKDGMMKMPCY